MKSFPLTWLLVFLATYFLSGMFAALIFTTTMAPSFGTYMRPGDDFSGMGYMLPGFILMSLAITMIFAHQDRAVPAMTRGLQAGLWVAAVLVSDYLIVIGWSTIPPQPMLLSGLISAIAPLVGGVVAGLYNKSADLSAS